MSKEIEVKITKKELFNICAPMFNFELDAEQIAEKGVEKKILKKIDDDNYLIIDKEYHWMV